MGVHAEPPALLRFHDGATEGLNDQLMAETPADQHPIRRDSLPHEILGVADPGQIFIDTVRTAADDIGVVIAHILGKTVLDRHCGAELRIGKIRRQQVRERVEIGRHHVRQVGPDMGTGQNADPHPLSSCSACHPGSGRHMVHRMCWPPVTKISVPVT